MTMIIQPKIPSVSLDEVRTYNFARHYVIPGFQADSIEQVARNLVGLHSARLLTPFVTLHTRVNGFGTDDLRRELSTSGRLIKLRCMRGTLHILPLDLAPIAHQATLRIRLRECFRVYKHLGLSLDYVSELKGAITEVVRKNPKSINEILSQMRVFPRDVVGADDWKSLVRTVVKHLWEEGTFCYINRSDYWGGEKRFYGHTSEIYPELYWHSVSVSEAQKDLVRCYITQYGPVTEEDICWWTGLGKRTIRKSINQLKDELISMNVQGFGSNFYMLQSDFERFLNFQWEGSSWLALLAYEDPSLKGYFESRDRYIDSQHYDLLFNGIGEARASVVLNGRVIGIWAWDKRQKCVSWDMFEKLDGSRLLELGQLVQKLEDFLVNSDQKQSGRL